MLKVALDIAKELHKFVKHLVEIGSQPTSRTQNRLELIVLQKIKQALKHLRSLSLTLELELIDPIVEVRSLNNF